MVYLWTNRQCPLAGEIFVGASKLGFCGLAEGFDNLCKLYVRNMEWKPGNPTPQNSPYKVLKFSTCIFGTKIFLVRKSTCHRWCDGYLDPFFLLGIRAKQLTLPID